MNTSGTEDAGLGQSSRGGGSDGVFSRPKWMGGDEGGSGDDRSFFDKLFNNGIQNQPAASGGASGSSGRIVL